MRCGAIVLACAIGLAGRADAEPCPGNPNALGTSRTLVVEQSAHPLIGRMQYPGSLPLADKEVVITFDDGPLPPYTNRILDALAAECVKVTFFLVGQMARAYPDVVRQIYNAGHTIGTHSNNHPVALDAMAFSFVQAQVDGGVAAVRAALGHPAAVAPFFRAPGLARTNQLERYLATQSISIWSTDAHGADYTGINAAQVVRRSIEMLEARRGGVLLLHDIQPVTANAISALLKELKARGYRIVHAVAPGERPALPEPLVPAPAVAAAWPRVLPAAAADPGPKAPSDHAAPAVTGASEAPSAAKVAIGPAIPRQMQFATGAPPSQPAAAAAPTAVTATAPQPASAVAADPATTESIAKRKPRIADNGNAKTKQPQKPAEWTLLGSLFGQR